MGNFPTPAFIISKTISESKKDNLASRQHIIGNVFKIKASAFDFAIAVSNLIENCKRTEKGRVRE